MTAHCTGGTHRTPAEGGPCPCGVVTSVPVSPPSVPTAEAADRWPRVAGYCPMGCGDTLVLRTSGRISCTWVDCPRPSAVDELLADSEVDHQVTFYEDTFTVRHPLSERLDDQLLTCGLHQDLVDLDGPPVPVGTYRAVLLDDTSRPRIWTWAALG